jgi:hypothetical protein
LRNFAARCTPESPVDVATWAFATLRRRLVAGVVLHDHLVGACPESHFVKVMPCTQRRTIKGVVPEKNARQAGGSPALIGLPTEVYRLVVLARADVFKDGPHESALVGIVLFGEATVRVADRGVRIEVGNEGCRWSFAFAGGVLEPGAGVREVAAADVGGICTSDAIEPGANGLCMMRLKATW